MKSRLLVFCTILCAFCVSGCVSTGVKPQTIDTVAAVVQPVAKNVVNAVLEKNPEYDDALLALATAAEVALNGGELNVQSIKSFVDALGVKYQLDAHTKLVIASGIDDLVRFYQATYAQQVADTADPNVRRILTAFAAGVRDGVAFHRALRSG
jgi:uncharacterized protein CbrC (UPF0167 family)